MQLNWIPDLISAKLGVTHLSINKIFIAERL